MGIILLCCDPSWIICACFIVKQYNVTANKNKRNRQFQSLLTSKNVLEILKCMYYEIRFYKINKQ